MRPDTDNGYVGWSGDAKRRKLEVRLLCAMGVHAFTKPRTGTIWCRPGETVRAREIRRGFRTGLELRGDAFDFLLGLRAALFLHTSQRRELGCARVSAKKNTVSIIAPYLVQKALSSGR